MASVAVIMPPTTTRARGCCACAPLPVEFVMRAYLTGVTSTSVWTHYQRGERRFCGYALPDGMKKNEPLPRPLLTPTTKASSGGHDENISFEEMIKRSDRKLAETLRDLTLRVYRKAADYALTKGIIIADTKFEFGVDNGGKLYLIDEALTPDSSRFWPADTYQPGVSPPSFDKQFVRDYLETLDWDKRAPGPRLPPDVIARTSAKYREALARLTAP